jgi:hypothetical protein
MRCRAESSCSLRHHPAKKDARCRSNRKCFDSSVTRHRAQCMWMLLLQCSQFKYTIIIYLKFQHDKHETGCAQVLLNALEMSYISPICVSNFKKFSGAMPPIPRWRGTPTAHQNGALIVIYLRNDHWCSDATRQAAGKRLAGKRH